MAELDCTVWLFNAGGIADLAMFAGGKHRPVSSFFPATLPNRRGIADEKLVVEAQKSR